MLTWPTALTVMHDAQAYRLIGERPVELPSGKIIGELIWETDCPDCGVIFQASTWRTFRTPRRFCDACKAPGKRVKAVRKQRAPTSDRHARTRRLVAL